MESIEGAFDNRYGQVFTGWFKAPVSANYRFYVAADDKARLYIDYTTPYDESDPDSLAGQNMTLVSYLDSWKSWREYFYWNYG